MSILEVMRRKRVVAYILIVLLVSYIIGQVRQLRVWREKQRQIDELGVEMSQVEEQNRLLQAELERAKTREAVERAIRDKLGWSKPDEQVVVVPGTERETGISVGSERKRGVGGWSGVAVNVEAWLGVFGW